MGLLLSVPLVDTASILAPSDLRTKLEQGTLAFDAPEVIARYEALFDAYVANTDASLDLPYLVVANEADIFLKEKPDGAWTALASFLVTVRTYVRGKRPATRVGINVSFAGVTDPALTAKVRALTASADALFLSYYLGDNGLGTVGTDVGLDIDRAVAFAGTKPLILKELGYATNVSTQSAAGQRAFVRDWFAAWDRNAAHVPVVTMSRMYDGKRADCEAEAASYMLAGNEPFIRYLCSLGLHEVDGTAKEAWPTFQAASHLRGF
jgi:hypothetical protein